MPELVWITLIGLLCVIVIQLVDIGIKVGKLLSRDSKEFRKPTVID